jgi:hypothetical protein
MKDIFQREDDGYCDDNQCNKRFNLTLYNIGLYFTWKPP